jgi:ssDNA-binding Zn-finger/Zn-ribbon topoisomerase 1
MRYCQVCNSKMIIRLSKKEPFIGKYFWGCTSFPSCNNIQSTILEKKDFQHYYLGNDTANSMLELNQSDIVTDAKRHFALSKHFNHDYVFQNSDFDTIDILLGFESRDDFHFWVATQQTTVTHSVHHHLPTGSPYYFTFRKLTDFINQYFENAINSITSSKKNLIEKSIFIWTDFFRRQAEVRFKSNKVSEDKIKSEHEEAINRKALKASEDIFNAIRRKDLKAIEALRKKGADLTFRNQDGLTCLDFAKTFNDERLFEALTNNISE